MDKSNIETNTGKIKIPVGFSKLSGYKTTAEKLSLRKAKNA
jgi:hypothetical protein